MRRKEGTVGKEDYNKRQTRQTIKKKKKGKGQGKRNSLFLGRGKTKEKHDRVLVWQGSRKKAQWAEGFFFLFFSTSLKKRTIPANGRASSIPAQILDRLPAHNGGMCHGQAPSPGASAAKRKACPGLAPGAGRQAVQAGQVVQERLWRVGRLQWGLFFFLPPHPPPPFSAARKA